MCDQETCRLAESVVVSGGWIVFTMSSDVYTKTDECSWWNSAEKRATDWFLPFLSIRHESAGGSLEVWVSVRAQIWNCVFVVFVCFRLSLFFLLCCGVLFVCIFPTTRPELSWLCVSFGGFFSFLLWCFFAGSLSQNGNETNQKRQQKPNAGVYLSSCTQRTRATPILEIIVSLLRSGFIFTPFFLIPLSLALSPARFQNKPQTTSFTRWARLLRLNSPDRLTS